MSALQMQKYQAKLAILEGLTNKTPAKVTVAAHSAINGRHATPGELTGNTVPVTSCISLAWLVVALGSRLPAPGPNETRLKPPNHEGPDASQAQWFVMLTE